MTRPSIVIVDGSTAVTGGLRGAIRIARLLEPWADTTLVLPAGSRVTATESSDFVDVVHLPLVPLRKTAGAVALYGPALLVAGWRLRRLLARKRATALIINDFVMMQGVVARALGYRGRIVTWVRFDPTRFPRLLSRAWLAAAYRASNAVVAVSDFIVRLLPPDPKLVRIYDTVDLDLPDAAASRPTDGARDVLCVANYIRDKGQHHAVSAFAAVAGDFPDARLILHGGHMGLAKNRDYLASLKADAAALGLAHRIVFNGFATDLASVYEQAAAALILSESESFGLSCLEASQLGVPVIAFRSGGPAEIVEDGVTGFLCDLGDVDAVAAALRRLLGDPQAAYRMGQAGAAHVQRKFGRESFIASARTLLGI